MHDPKPVAQAVLDTLPPAARELATVAETVHLLADEILLYGAGTVPLPAATHGNEGLVAMLCEDVEAAARLAGTLAPAGGEERTPRVLEVATGEGFPGFVLSRMCPHAQVEVIEPDLRRAWLLRRLINLVSVRNLRVRVENLESLTARGPEPYDLVLIKHVPIATSVGQGGPLLRPGGCLALWQTDEPHEAALQDAGRELELSAPQPHAFASPSLRGRVLMLAHRPAPPEPAPVESEPKTDEDPVSVRASS